ETTHTPRARDGHTGCAETLLILFRNQPDVALKGLTIGIAWRGWHVRRRRLVCAPPVAVVNSLRSGGFFNHLRGAIEESLKLPRILMLASHLHNCQPLGVAS